MELDDSTAMEIADLYEPWEVGHDYKPGKIVKYGVNADNETQLYTVLQEHTSQEDWTPDAVPALYAVIDVAHAGTQDNPNPGRSGHGVRLRPVLHRQRGREAIPVPAHRGGGGRYGGIAVYAA